MSPEQLPVPADKQTHKIQTEWNAPYTRYWRGKKIWWTTSIMKAHLAKVDHCVISFTYETHGVLSTRTQKRKMCDEANFKQNQWRNIKHPMAWTFWQKMLTTEEIRNVFHTKIHRNWIPLYSNETDQKEKKERDILNRQEDIGENQPETQTLQESNSEARVNQ